MNKYIFDTSAYVRAIRSGNAKLMEVDTFLDSNKESTIVCLSVVVLHELLVGSVKTSLRDLVYSMASRFEQSEYLIDIDRDDWIAAAEVIRQAGQKYSFEQVKRSRLTNDALIAVSCSRRGIILLTENINDFARLSEFCSLQYCKPDDLTLS